MTTPPTKSLALELAERIYHGLDWYEFDYQTWCIEASRELRRLASVESELAALKEALRGLEPVAWRHKKYEHVQVNADFLPDEAKRNYTENGQWESLYTLPPNLKG